MGPRRKLFEVADSQQGYFTSKQAEGCGMFRAHFHRKIRTGEWVKVERGIYRLVQYPVTNRPELALWTLWSRDKRGIPQGVWSHETALDIHDLCDVMPAKMHMTVPIHFRRGKIPGVLRLHFKSLAKKDILLGDGYAVTNPKKTLLDVIEENILSEDLIIQAIQEGLKRGLLIANELKQNPQFKKYESLYKF